MDFEATRKSYILNAEEIIQSLSKSVEFVKEFVYQFNTDPSSLSDHELLDKLKELDKWNKQIRIILSNILGSSPDHEYHQIHARNHSTTQATEHKQRSNVVPYLENGQEHLSRKSSQIDIHCQNPEENGEKNIHLLKMKMHQNSTIHLIDYARHISFNDKDNSSNTKMPLPPLSRIAEYMEPHYETFFCPLTHSIIDDPVTIESGMTFERCAIVEWFKKLNDNGGPLVCPSTGVELTSSSMITNIALKVTIDHWKERNQAVRLKVAMAALSPGSSDDMIMEALRELQTIWNLARNRTHFHKLKIVPLLAQLVGHRTLNVRCETLDTLEMMAEEDHEKELIEQTGVISSAVKLLSNGTPEEQLAAVSFLLKLSNSNFSLCEKIGSMPGAILLLITMKYNDSDPMAAEKASKTLINLVKCPRNIKIMAENGLLKPLISNLTKGSEEMQLEMACYLSELVLANDSKLYVAERGSSSLIQMAQISNLSSRKYAFSALVKISSFNPSSKILIEKGIAPVLADQLFSKESGREEMELKELSAMVLVYLLESTLDIENIQVSEQGHNMVSDYVIYNIIDMIKRSSIELIRNLIRILLRLTESPKAVTILLSAIKDPETVHSLVELINYPQQDLIISSTKLLIVLSSHIGNTLAEKLCRTFGQPDKLIKAIDTNQVTEIASVSANLLAKLPPQNLSFNKTLADRNSLPIALTRLQEIQSGATKASRFLSSFIEGLVGILVRFTFNLHDSDILCLVMMHDLSLVFTELLMRPVNDEVQILSAVGLENLSFASISLSQFPTAPKKKKSGGILPGFRKTKSTTIEVGQCPIHRGACPSRTTFCLLYSRALENLLACLDHRNSELVKASLSAICTLLDDRVNAYAAVIELEKVNTVEQVLKLLKDHKDMGVWQKSFWIIERFLVHGQSLQAIMDDKVLPATLVTAFQHGDISIKQMAERILRHFNKMPNFSEGVVKL